MRLADTLEAYASDIAEKAARLYGAVQCTPVFLPEARAGLGDLRSDFCLRLAAELRTAPYQIFCDLMQLNNDQREQFNFEDGILYVRVPDIAGLFEATEDFLPATASLPSSGVVLLLRDSDLSEMAYWRLNFCAIWQGFFAGRQQNGSKLAFKKEICAAGDAFKLVPEILNSEELRSGTDRAARLDELQGSLRRLNTADTRHIWVHSTCFSADQIKDLYAADRALTVHTLNREWLHNQDDYGLKKISMVRHLLQERCLSLPYLFMSPRCLADIDFSAAELKTKENILWLNQTTLARIARLDFKGSEDCADLPPERSVVNLERLMHNLLFFDYFERVAGQGYVTELFEVVYSLSEQAYKYLNFPDQRARWESRRFSGIEKKLLACLENRLSAIVLWSRSVSA